MRILVSGAGIAGLSAGVNLSAAGHDVTIVERAQHLRVNGSPIDVRGESLEIAAKMGVLDALRAREVDMTRRTCYVDFEGKVVAALPLDEINDSAEDLEIPREDLSHVLRNALDQSVPLTLGESIAALHDDARGVDVRFASGDWQRYDLVVGADGLHSLTRRLSFGPEEQYLQHLGVYVALAALPDRCDTSAANPLYNFPGHLAGIAAYRTKALAVFMFRSPWIDYDYHDLAAQKQLLTNAYAARDEWIIPELLDAARRDPDLYFDSASQIHMPTWHTGRVVLVGDAAHCASPLSGRGASLAITGTWLLAEALRDHPDDLETALKQYQHNHLPRVTRAQRTAISGRDRAIPTTQEAIDERNRNLSAINTG